MRILSFIICANLVVNLPLPIFGMQKLIQYLDKSIDPITYITQQESINHCQEVLKLNPTHPDHEKFEIGKKWTDADTGSIGKAIRRQKQLLIEAEGSIVGYDDRWLNFFGTARTPNPTTAETLMRAHEQISGYFSPHQLAVFRGYARYKMKKDNTTAVILDTFLKSAQNLPAPQAETNSVETKKKEYTETTTYEAFKDKVLKDNFTWLECLNNWWRKNQADTLGHLTHDKTKMFSNQLLRYDPNHLGHNSDLWHLNPDNEVHKKHIHKTFERERLLCDLVCLAISRDNYEELLQISPVNPKNPTAVTIPPGYFSPVLMAMILGYLEVKATTVSIGANIKLFNQSKLCVCNKPECNECTQQKKNQNLEKDCICNPPKKLKDCQICLKSQQVPHPQVPTNSFTECWCKPPKKFDECDICLKALEQQLEL